MRKSLISHLKWPDPPKGTRVETVKLEDIQPGPVRGPLTPEQERRIRGIHETFIEVFPCTLEETYLNFRRDMAPDREIAIWEGMGRTYKAHVGVYKTLEARKGLFDAILQTGRPPSS